MNPDLSPRQEQIREFEALLERWLAEDDKPAKHELFVLLKLHLLQPRKATLDDLRGMPGGAYGS